MEPQSTKPLLSGCPLWPQEICQLLEIALFCMADFWIQIWYLSSAFFGRLCNNSSKFFQLSFYIWVQPLFDSCRTFWSRTFSTPRFKVEKILKVSLDLIHLQWKFKLWAGKFAWGVKGKSIVFKSLFDITRQCFALLPRVNFPVNNLNFHWRWRWQDQIQAIFLNLFYFNP